MYHIYRIVHQLLACSAAYYLLLYHTCQEIEHYKPPKVLLMFILHPCSLKITNVLTANITDFPGFLTLSNRIKYYVLYQTSFSHQVYIIHPCCCIQLQVICFHYCIVFHIQTYHNPSILSTVDGHLECICFSVLFFAVMNNAGHSCTFFGLVCTWELGCWVIRYVCVQL